ncbi:MAG: hypothetical protein WCE20_07295 [Rhizomicrobium sp.]
MKILPLLAARMACRNKIRRAGGFPPTVNVWAVSSQNASRLMRIFVYDPQMGMMTSIVTNMHQNSIRTLLAILYSHDLLCDFRMAVQRRRSQKLADRAGGIKKVCPLKRIDTSWRLRGREKSPPSRGRAPAAEANRLK